MNPSSSTAFKEIDHLPSPIAEFFGSQFPGGLLGRITPIPSTAATSPEFERFSRYAQSSTTTRGGEPAPALSLGPRFKAAGTAVEVVGLGVGVLAPIVTPLDETTFVLIGSGEGQNIGRTMAKSIQSAPPANHDSHSRFARRFDALLAKDFDDEEAGLEVETGITELLEQYGPSALRDLELKNAMRVRPDTLAAVFRGIGEFGRHEGVQEVRHLLLKCLKNSNPSIRYAAIEGLSRVRGESMTAALKQHLDREVNRTIKQLIKSITRP